MKFQSCKKKSPTVFASMAIATKFHQMIFVFCFGKTDSNWSNKIIPVTFDKILFCSYNARIVLVFQYLTGFFLVKAAI